MIQFIPAQVELFFYWINERHRIYTKRRGGDAPPWTDDKILREYSFTNVFRQLDRTTIELNRRINGPPLINDPLPDRLYRIMLFRAFNRTATYDAIHAEHLESSFPKMRKMLHARKKAGHKIFTGAYIITNAGQSTNKIDLMVDALGVMYRERQLVWASIAAEPTMKNATEVIRRLPMQGDFTAYEVVCDLRFQKKMLLEKAKDRTTWANPGPGAMRGLRRLMTGKFARSSVRLSKAEAIEGMRALLNMAPDYLGDHVKSEKLPFEMREIEHSLCEFDKYSRVKNGEGRPRGKFRPQEKLP